MFAADLEPFLIITLLYAFTGAWLARLDPRPSQPDVILWAGSYGTAGMAMASAMSAQFG